MNRSTHAARSTTLIHPALFVPILLLAACDPTGGGGGGGDPLPAETSRLLVTADTTVIAPASTPAPAVDLGRIGATGVETNYRLTTPAGMPFSFDLVSWRDGAAGEVSVAIAHVSDDGTVPANAETSLVEAGILLHGKGLVRRDGWSSAKGDGFVRLTLQGKITRDQVIAVATGPDRVSLIDIGIGELSGINRPESGGGDPLPGIVSRQTIFSSNAAQFGLPTLAVSGDRTSIVCYEGDQQPESTQRYELRLQHDAATDVVTGGGSIETSVDSGYWRDHEIAALHNVLAVARSEADGTAVRFSFDRGASFAQTVVLPGSASQARLVQVAMAADYTIAITTWCVVGDGVEMTLFEGGPIAFDANGSPSWFEFGPAQVVHTMPIGATPLTTGIAWSAGGDLVVGYGASWFEATPGFGWRSTTEFRCAVRRYGEALEDQLVERQEIIGMDPTVAVLGQGASMQIFYAYEVQTGVRLAHSDDGGASFVLGPVVGHAGDHLPSVFAREVGATTRVDVLYLGSRLSGTELHQSRWLDWPAEPREDVALTTARLEQVAPPIGDPMTVFFGSMRGTQIGWLGYDAVVDGAEIVVAYDEVTFESSYWGGPPGGIFVGGGISIPTTTLAGGNPFVPATPPPLAAGMTEPVRAVDPTHAHQLVLLRLR